MGGPMSVNDPDPWIAEETAFIRSAMLAETPVLGVCLGSQFMAKALGAAVCPSKAVNIGMTPIKLTPEAENDPVFKTLPESFEVFEWHGEVFNLPKDRVPLAGSAIAPSKPFATALALMDSFSIVKWSRAGSRDYVENVHRI
jgi:GMP synthase-like glutamine amidotransferase